MSCAFGSWHRHCYGTTRAQIAAAAGKNHRYGALNPYAQYRFRMIPDAVLADRPVRGPLTRAHLQSGHAMTRQTAIRFGIFG